MPLAFFIDQSFMTFVDGRESAEQKSNSSLHFSIQVG